ncbi:hypothetical protein FCM35_KLT07239 [Carex littledalei]|uniref:Uncharacterized protein n=1 Tax=Carex littledalei TaxID=544730 RepID=A0A833QS37_9POAL|nr:hypothetical protein FCM35_KLT07239 [Carex littledalei]
MDYAQYMLDEMPAHHEWALQDIKTSILKCTRWQVEETTDFVNCSYHYFCDSTYVGDYPAFIDLVVLMFISYCFMATTFFTLVELTTAKRGIPNNWILRKRKYLLPSGPILLPLVLLILAKGQRINTIFPISHVGPAILLLLQVSALAFRNEADQDLRYAVLEASTVSGILHASLYVDAVILPYYTGLEALMGSRLSGECTSCVCRNEPLIVGGKSATYRGLSRTTLSIIFALCSRMVCRIYGEEKISVSIRNALEGLSWFLVAFDSVFLIRMSPEWINCQVVCIGVLALICFNVFGKVYRFLGWLELRKMQRKLEVSSIP